MAIDLIDVLEKTKRESREIRATMHVPTAEAQFQKQVLSTGQQQVDAVAAASDVAVQAANAQDALGKAQSAIQVDLAVAQADADSKYVADVAPALAGKEAQAAILARRSKELGDIAAKKHDGPLAVFTYIADQFKASVIKDDLQDAAMAMQGYDAQMQVAQTRRNQELTIAQNEMVVIPTALAKDRHVAAVTGLQAKGIIADSTFKAAQINEDTTGQIRQSAQVGWQYEESKRQAAAQKAAANAENHDGIYLIAATRYAQKNGGRWPTREQLKQDAAGLTTAKEIYRTMPDAEKGAFVIAGTRAYAKGFDQKGGTLQEVLTDITNDAPATTSAALYDMAGESQNSRGIGAALTPLVTAAVAAAEADNAKNPTRSAAEKKAKVDAARKGAIERAGQMPQEQLFDEASKAMQRRSVNPTGSDVNTSVLQAISNPLVSKQVGLNPQVLQILNSAPGRKILDDAPIDSTRGFTEKMFKLNQLLEANGVKDSHGQLAKFSRAALQVQYANSDPVARELYLAGKGDYIPIKLEVSGASAVRAPSSLSFMGAVAADTGYDFGEYSSANVNLDDPAAFRRHLLMYQRSLQFNKRDTGPTSGQVPSGIFLGRSDTPQ